MTIEEARHLVAQVNLQYSSSHDGARELWAQMMVQAYELGWAHGRLARESAEDRERKGETAKDGT